MQVDDYFEQLLTSCSELNESAPELSLQEYFRRVWSSPKVRDVKLSALCNGQKSAKQSLEFRSQGNDAYKRADLSSALAFYSKAVLYAPQTGTGAELQPLALAYGNRSLILHKTKHYGECLNDIELAIKFGYPQEKQLKLFQRRAECLEALGDYGGAAESLREAVIQCDVGDSSNSIREKLAALDLKRHAGERPLNFKSHEKTHTGERPLSLKSHEKAHTGENPLSLKSHEITHTFENPSNFKSHEKTHTGERPLDENPWKSVPPMVDGSASVSSAVELAVSYRKGRHYIATRDIDPDEIVLVEKPYAHTLHRPERLTHCTNCVRRVPVPTPCRSCSTVIYCSESCEREAWQSFHRVECQIVPFTEYFSELIEMSSDDRDPGSMNLVDAFSFALRALLKAGVKTLYQRFLKDGGKVDLEPAKVLPDVSSGGFNSMMNLIWRNDRHDPNRFMTSAPGSILFLKLLRMAPFIEELYSSGSASSDASIGSSEISNSLLQNPEQMLDFKVYLCSTLYLVFQVCKLNTIIMAEYELVQPRFTGPVCDPSSGVDMHYIGSSISLQASLFNHSCYPNVAYVSHSTRGVFRASRPIPKGVELCIAYYSSYDEEIYDDRRPVLRNRFDFDCLCQACEENWAPVPFLQPEFVQQFPMAPMLGAKWYCSGCRKALAITQEKCKKCSNSSRPNAQTLFTTNAGRELMIALKEFGDNRVYSEALLHAEIEWLKYLERLFPPPCQLMLDAIHTIVSCFQVQGNCYDKRANKKKAKKSGTKSSRTTVEAATLCWAA